MSTALRYVNPYSGISTNFIAGLNQIADTLSGIGPAVTIEQLVNTVYDYVSTTYGLTPDALGEQNSKFMISELINGYLNYNLLYTPEQTQFIHRLIGGTLAPCNPQDILQHITDVEEEVAQSSLPASEQAPLLYATAIGKAAYTYWAAIVTTPGDWAIYTGGFTPAITKFPYWVAAAMQGTLIGLNIFNLPSQSDFNSVLQAINAGEGRLILLTMFGSLTINSGKVVYNWQQKIADNTNSLQTRTKGNSGDPNGIIIAFRWGNYEGQGRGCSPSWGLCYIEIYLAPPLSSPGIAKLVGGQLDISIDESNIPSQFNEQLATGSIPVSRDIQLPEALCRLLGIKAYTIKAGNYTFTHCCGAYHFKF